MGVQGFTPFLQKTVPHIIHQLPNRLRDLAGKKLVLDGTLLTQRLHYAPSPHPFRHVLGWYNLARELNDNNIRAVCIFDGNLRTKAKARELIRREASRKLHVSRGTLESVRIKRLQKLKSVMANVRTLDEKGKSAIAEMLSRLNVNDGTGTVGTVEGLNRVGETLRVLSGAATPSVEEARPVEQERKREQEQVATPTAPLTVDEERVEEQKAAITPETEPSIVEASPIQEQPQDSKVIGFGIPTLGVPASVSSAEDIKLVILSSYRDFRSSISKVASLSLPERKPKVPASVTLVPIPTEETETQEEDLVLTKTQCELTLEEGKVWDELALATSPVIEPAPAPIPALPVSIPTSLEVPPTSPPLEGPPPEAALPPSTAKPLETPSTSLPLELPPAAALPPAVSASSEPLSPPEIETSSPLPEAETPSPPPETESPPAVALPTAIPAFSELPPPPPETEALSPVSETEIPLPPPETQVPSSLPETEIPATAALPTAIPASSEPPSPPPEAAPTATLPTVTQLPPPEVEEQKPEPAGFVLDHFVLSAAEDRLDALASRSEVVADSYQRRTFVPTKSTYRESREILEAMGVPCYEIQGEHEGEGVASSLVLEGMADYVVSEDTDVLVYGAPILRNITSHGSPLTLIHGNEVREALGLSNDACIDFAILLGTDFSQRIRNVGPIRALKLIKEYETIENILNSQTKHQPTIPHAQYMAQVNSARAIFSSPPLIPSQLRLAATSTELVDQAKVAVVMERCGLGRALVADSFWDYEAALDGNYFSDNPSTIVS